MISLLYSCNYIYLCTKNDTLIDYIFSRIPQRVGDVIDCVGLGGYSKLEDVFSWLGGPFYYFEKIFDFFALFLTNNFLNFFKFSFFDEIFVDFHFFFIFLFVNMPLYLYTGMVFVKNFFNQKGSPLTEDVRSNTILHTTAVESGNVHCWPAKSFPKGRY